MSRSADRTCPVAGSPCLSVLDDLRIELARVRAREEGRPLIPCRGCGERNRIALGGSTLCYVCRVRPIEGNHVRGTGSGPAVLRMDANAHRVANEGERIWREVGRGDLCTPCVFGYGLRIGILLSRLEVDL